MSGDSSKLKDKGFDSFFYELSIILSSSSWLALKRSLEPPQLSYSISQEVALNLIKDGETENSKTFLLKKSLPTNILLQPRILNPDKQYLLQLSPSKNIFFEAISEMFTEQNLDCGITIATFKNYEEANNRLRELKQEYYKVNSLAVVKRNTKGKMVKIKYLVCKTFSELDEDDISIESNTHEEKEDLLIHNFLLEQTYLLKNTDISFRNLVFNELHFYCKIALAFREKLNYGDLMKKKILYIVGSDCINVATKNSDMDMVCIGPKKCEHNTFFNIMKSILQWCPFVKIVRHIADSKIPVLKLKLEKGLECDIQYCQLEIDSNPLTMNYNELNEKDPFSVNMLAFCAIKDGNFLRNVQSQSFILSLLYVKLWSKNRCITGNAVGFFGGLTWAILVYKAFLNCKKDERNCEKILQMFFKMFSEWDWENEINVCLVNNIPRKQEKETVRVYCPSHPRLNSTKNINTATLQILKDEFCRAQKIVENANKNNQEIICWDQIAQKIEFFKAFPSYIRFEIQSQGIEELESHVGLILSRIHVPVSQLQKQKIMAWPHAQAKFNSRTSAYCFIALKPFNLEGKDVKLPAQNFVTSVKNLAINLKFKVIKKEIGKGTP